MPGLTRIHASRNRLWLPLALATAGAATSEQVGGAIGAHVDDCLFLIIIQANEVSNLRAGLGALWRGLCILGRDHSEDHSDELHDH